MNVHNTIIDFINDPSDLNFATAVSALVEYRDYYNNPTEEKNINEELKAENESLKAKLKGGEHHSETQRATIRSLEKEIESLKSKLNKTKNQPAEQKQCEINKQDNLTLAKNIKFPTEEKHQQFCIITKHLTDLGIEISLHKNNNFITCWKLKWDKDTAMLVMGPDWEIASLHTNKPLKGQFEGFDLLDNLDCNGIDVSEW